MSESYVCPKCNSTKFIGYDDASGAECKECGHFIPDNELDDYAYVKIKKSELARRDEIIKQQGEVSVIFQEQLSRRDETIRRLKEDAERLAGKLISMYADEMYECSYCGHGVSKSPDEIDHAPDCPITLHRALMKEIGG